MRGKRRKKEARGIQGRAGTLISWRGGYTAPEGCIKKGGELIKKVRGAGVDVKTTGAGLGL